MSSEQRHDRQSSPRTDRKGRDDDAPQADDRPKRPSDDLAVSQLGLARQRCGYAQAAVLALQRSAGNAAVVRKIRIDGDRPSAECTSDPTVQRDDVVGRLAEFGDSSVTRDPNRTSAVGVRTRGERMPVGTAGRVMVQRQEAGKRTPKARPAKPKAPEKRLTFGQTSFTKRARDAVLQRGALLPGVDNKHVAIRPDGLLGYDPDYVGPTDPFRWEKVKFIVDSGAKVRVDLVSMTDEFDVLTISDGKSEKTRMSLLQAGALGYTLITVAIQRALQPKGNVIASTSSDTNQVFFTTDMGGDPSSSALAHELFGHLFLALKGVPFTHPKDPKEIKARGTLGEKHGIKDPLGGTYKGTVENYIDLYAGSKALSALKSPTQFVSVNQLRSALKSFKTDFGTKAKGTLNRKWNVPDSLGLSWDVISANYRVAETADPKLQTSIEGELAAWYGTLTADQQFVFMSYLLTMLRQDILTKLASALLAKIKAPAGMRSPDDLTP